MDRGKGDIMDFIEIKRYAVSQKIKITEDELEEAFYLEIFI